MTPLDSTEHTAPPHSESEARLGLWYRGQPQTPQQGPLRVVYAPDSALRTAPRSSSHPLTHTHHHHQRSTSSWLHSGPLAPAVRAASRPPILLSHLGIPLLFCSLLLPAPTPPTSHCSAGLSHGPWTTASGSHGSWCLSSPASQVCRPRAPRCPSLLYCLATFFSGSPVLCFPRPLASNPNTDSSLSIGLPRQHSRFSAPYLLAPRAPRTAASLLTFLGGPGPPWSQKQRERKWHQANELAQRMWASAGLHGPQAELSVRRRLKPRQPQHR